MRDSLGTSIVLACALLAGCGEDANDETMGSSDTGIAEDGMMVDSGSTGMDMAACDADPVVMTTALGVDFVRTPDACFENLPGWPYLPHYVDIDGLRQAYVDEGPPEGPVVLLLHGQPSWSYLYRRMIPVLVAGGYRVIAMDHLGMGRSDKPVDIGSYSFLGHNHRLLQFIERLDLRDINLFVQDWGSLIGLRIAGLHPERFARIAVGDGTLPVVPAGIVPYPPVENPHEVVDLPSPFAHIPAQQGPFFAGCEPLSSEGSFGDWMTFSMKSQNFRPSDVLEALTWFDIPEPEQFAYDAPFPSRSYMAGVRVFPSLVNELPGVNAEAWAGLTAFERPFLTIWADNDPGTLGQCATQQRLIDEIPGAAGLPHERLAHASHFLQDDQGEAIATRLVPFFSSHPVRRGTRYCEVLVVKSAESRLIAEVWGTPGLNDCPAPALQTLDLEAVRIEHGALQAMLNGPRRFLVSSLEGSLPSGERAMFGELEMRRMATVPVEPGEMSSQPYEPRIVERTTVFTFDAEEEIYELVDPEGTTYVMQSMSEQVDPGLTLESLAGLGARLQLPEGWSYVVRTLADDLRLVADGEARVVQDELANTYQRR